LNRVSATSSASLIAYGDPDLRQLAAIYAAGTIQNHLFLVGHTRTGFLLAYTFLALNGLQLSASQADVMTTALLQMLCRDV